MSIKREFISKTKEQFYEEIKKYQKTFKPTKEVEGFGSIPIVGEKNYPFLKTHNVSNEGEESSFMNSGDLVKKEYSEVFKAKAKNILGSTESEHIRKPHTRIKEEIRDIYKARKPIIFSSEFEKEIKFNKVQVNKTTGIVGAKNPLLNLEAVENTTTSKQIEKFTSEDIKAKYAITTLYDKGINEHQITSLLALGSFGVEVNKRLVPTRWAITAYDKTIEKFLFNQIQSYSSISSFELYYREDKGNAFVILLLPSEDLQGEIVEAFSTNVLKDYFDTANKLDKAEPATAGGYFATKVAIFESLVHRKKKASIISLRTIEDYEVPLGVVFVRETVREAMKGEKTSFSSLEDLKEYLQNFFPKHNKALDPSTVLKELKSQRKLHEFF